MEYTIGTRVFGDWEIIGTLGAGASGHVYEIQKEMRGISSRAALKVIQIPQTRDEIQQVISEGIDHHSVNDYFAKAIDDIIKEIDTMTKLKENGYVVRCEDYQFIEHSDGIGGDILIRMERLVSLNEYQMTHIMTEEETIRMGKNLCQALLQCHGLGLLHRDIKPENIFVSEDGHFKLGDFGLARTIEKNTIGFSKKGTEGYMAPEVYLGKKYDEKVDIYSLGVVLYKCLNKNRLPFLPATGVFSYSDREMALSRRMSGENLPKPADASEWMSKIILKACAYHASDRYASAKDMLTVLEQGNVEKGTRQRPKKEKRKLVLTAAVFTVLVAAGLFGMRFVREKCIELTEVQTESVRLTEESKNDSQENYNNAVQQLKNISVNTETAIALLPAIVTVADLNKSIYVPGIIVEKTDEKIVILAPDVETDEFVVCFNVEYEWDEAELKRNAVKSEDYNHLMSLELNREEIGEYVYGQLKMAEVYSGDSQIGMEIITIDMKEAFLRFDSGIVYEIENGEYMSGVACSTANKGMVFDTAGKMLGFYTNQEKGESVQNIQIERLIEPVF